MSKSLLARFKRFYEEGTGLSVTRSNLDIEWQSNS